MPPTAKSRDWLLLLHSLPAGRSTARVALWRQLRKCGAVAFKTSTHILPDGVPYLERLQWLAQQARHAGGDATIVHASNIVGTSDDEIVHLFNAERTRDYAEMATDLSRLIKTRRRPTKGKDHQLAKFVARFEEIESIDFFACPKREVVDMLLGQLRAQRYDPASRIERVQTTQFVRKVWLTRPRPEIDRVGSAWLIRRFIDPKARFVFSARPADHPGAVTFDMVDGRFSHVGDDCTFETLLKSFGIEDPAARRIGEMVHAADLEDGKFPHVEAVGIDRLLKGWARLGRTDEQLIEHGAECFGALYEFLRKQS